MISSIQRRVLRSLYRPHNILSSRSSSSSLGGLPSQFQVNERTQQLMNDIDESILSFRGGTRGSSEVEVTGNDMILEDLIALGELLTRMKTRVLNFSLTLTSCCSCCC